MTMATMAMRARPPITPPTMAPTGVEECVDCGGGDGEVGTGEVGVVVVGVVVVGTEAAAKIKFSIMLGIGC